jgi:hypothetical protein
VLERIGGEFVERHRYRQGRGRRQTGLDRLPRGRGSNRAARLGLRLLEPGLGTETGVGADMRFEAEGVRCTLRLPFWPEVSDCSS